MDDKKQERTAETKDEARRLEADTGTQEVPEKPNANDRNYTGNILLNHN